MSLSWQSSVAKWMAIHYSTYLKAKQISHLAPSREWLHLCGSAIIFLLHFGTGRFRNVMGQFCLDFCPIFIIHHYKNVVITLMSFVRLCCLQTAFFIATESILQNVLHCLWRPWEIQRPWMFSSKFWVWIYPTFPTFGAGRHAYIYKSIGLKYTL